MSTQASEQPRFAIYARYSTELQSDISIDDQLAWCRKVVAERGGIVVGEFYDGALSGWSLEREGLSDLRAFAAQDGCDAIIMWKFDRLMRDHDQAIVLKLLLRKEYGVKLYCVEGFSEDDDDSPEAAMMEQMLAVFSAFYSKNLSMDTKRAKRMRAERGEFNGSEAPIGYMLVTNATATKERPPGLYVHPELSVIVHQAFQMHATGQYSDGEVADWMNTQPAVQEARRGKKPIDKEVVRWMLQNKIYTGRVPHSDTQYKGALGQNRKGSRWHTREWFEGKHQGFISDELFERSRVVREGMATHHQATSPVHIYALHDRVFCVYCLANKPHELADDNYGRMRAYWHTENKVAHYRCLAKDRGYAVCGQLPVRANDLDAQVANILSTLILPAEAYQLVEKAIRHNLENEMVAIKMQELHALVRRIDFSGQASFFEPNQYLAKRAQLQEEFEIMRHTDKEPSLDAADLLRRFGFYWQQCSKAENFAEARKQLLSKMVARVFMLDKYVLGVLLHGDVLLISQQNQKAPSDIIGAFLSNSEFSATLFV